MKSSLNFLHYDVLETVYRYNPALDLEEEEITPNFSMDIQYIDSERNSAWVLFGIELGDQELKGNSFFVKVIIAGNFSLDLSVDEDVVENKEEEEQFINHLYKKATVSILYPYMRSLISNLTSNGTESPVILPPINISRLIDKGDFVTEHYPE